MAESDRSRASAYELHVVRMGMSVDQAARLSDLLLRCPPDVAERVQDQLWLRTSLTEQRRRTRIVERPSFDARADRLLALLDPPARAPWERTSASLAAHAARLAQ